MTRKSLQIWAFGTVGFLFLSGLLAFVMQPVDILNPLDIQPPDEGTSFVAMLDLRELVTRATPTGANLKFVTSGSGGGEGWFEHQRDSSYRHATTKKQ